MWRGALARSCRWTRCRSATSPTASTRDLDQPRDARATRPLPRPGLRERPDDPRCGTRETSPTPSSGASHELRRERLVMLARSGCGAAARARGRRARRRRPAPRRADDRLRPALRHLQARRACSSATPSASRGSCPATSAAGAARLRRQGPPADAAGQGADRSVVAAPSQRSRACAGRIVFLRGLRHGLGAHAGAGRRRVAQHAAPPARGLGHQRHEGGRQRRAQPVGARRLVGRGLPPGRRLGHRRRRGVLPDADGPGRGRGRGAVPAAGAGGRARASTTATPDGPAAALAGDDARLDGQARSRFNTHRMVREYTEALYLPAHRDGRRAAGVAALA